MNRSRFLAGFEAAVSGADGFCRVVGIRAEADGAGRYFYRYLGTVLP
jgi:hypothetical protein